MRRDEKNEREAAAAESDAVKQFYAAYHDKIADKRYTRRSGCGATSTARSTRSFFSCSARANACSTPPVARVF